MAPVEVGVVEARAKLPGGKARDDGLAAAEIPQGETGLACGSEVAGEEELVGAQARGLDAAGGQDMTSLLSGRVPRRATFALARDLAVRLDAQMVRPP